MASPSPLFPPVLAVAAAIALSACATSGGGGAPRAPAPARAVEASSLYTGVWHEIARNPMKLTDGCVAGETRFSRDAKGRLIDRDSCRVGSPAGKEKVFAGPMTLLDPPTNARFRTAYKVWGVLTVNRDYWVLDHGDDWFIAASPSFEDLAIFTRDPQVGAERRATLVARARSLGYDVSRLEYPAQPPR